MGCVLLHSHQHLHVQDAGWEHLLQVSWQLRGGQEDKEIFLPQDSDQRAQ